MLKYFYAAFSVAVGACISVLLFEGAARFILILPFIIGCFAALLILHVLCAGILSFFIKTDKKYKHGNFFAVFALETVDIVLALVGARVKLSGGEKLPKTPYLMVLNHRSMVDPLSGIVYFRKDRLTFVSKKENAGIPFLGKYLYTLNVQFLDREDSRAAVKTIADAAEIIKSGEGSVAICPEGTRNRTGKPLLDFHAGSFKIAQKAGCPVVVAVFRNTEKVFRQAVVRRTPVYIDVLEVIPPDQVAECRSADLAERTWKIMNDFLKEN